ncbi:MAG: hypothetical protein FWG64_12270 [Firmicutes bacterium]|nr:hypothetical protein [Bacillota bacterium]
MTRKNDDNINSLCEFLKLEHPECYDFKNRIKKRANDYATETLLENLANIENCNPIKTALISHNFTSKYTRLHLDSSAGGCKLTDEIYCKLWGWHFTNSTSRACPKELKTTLKLKQTTDFQLGSDTMNSFKTIYNKAIEIYEKEGLEHKVYDNENLQKYATLTHTIGNFTLIPFQIRFSNDYRLKNFNRYRGCNGKIKDTWDISLNEMKRYFGKEHEKYGKEFFKKYVDTFFLKMYVDENYNVLPLFSRPTRTLELQENPLPQTLDELNIFLEVANARILQRSLILLSELNKYH